MSKKKVEIIEYKPIYTIRKFHESNAVNRAIVGPVGSAKTTGGALEIGYYLPHYLFKKFGIRDTKWAVIRNVYRELIDTTMATVLEWFPNAVYRSTDESVIIRYKDDIVATLLFRACDKLKDVRRFKSLELTGVWIDEAIEVASEHKLILSTRIGRYPKASKWPSNEDVKKYFIETTNPPDITMDLYSDYAWTTPPPGPLPERPPLRNHVGFWQPPRENEPNLAGSYYDDLRHRFRDHPDWVEIYIDGKPGVIVRGKLVYNNFKRDVHVAKDPISWLGLGRDLYRGWDNSGNVPACVVVQVPEPMKYHVIKEFYSDKMNIAMFTKWVVSQCSILYPGAVFRDWADPAGNNEYPTKEGGFTSNAKLMEEAAEVKVAPSEQNLAARINSVDNTLAMIDGFLIDPSCVRLINGFLGGYCYPKIHNTGEYSDHIEKNRFSHLQDALQYVLVKMVRNAQGIELKNFRVPRPSIMRRVFGGI